MTLSWSIFIQWVFKLHSFLELACQRTPFCSVAKYRNELDFTSSLSLPAAFYAEVCVCVETRQHVMMRKSHCTRDSLYAVLLPRTTSVMLYHQPEILKEDFEWRQTSNQIYPITAFCVVRLEVWAVPSCTEP